MVFGLTMSNVTILSAIIVRREFGAASFGAVFGFASSIIQFTTAIGPSFYGVLREVSSSYQLPLLIAAALDVAAAVIVWSGRASAATMNGWPISAIHLQRGNECFLRDVDLAELPHLLLAFLLLLQKFAFARDVAAVAFCGHVLA